MRLPSPNSHNSPSRRDACRAILTEELHIRGGGGGGSRLSVNRLGSWKNYSSVLEYYEQGIQPATVPHTFRLSYACDGKWLQRRSGTNIDSGADVLRAIRTGWSAAAPDRAGQPLWWGGGRRRPPVKCSQPGAAFVPGGVQRATTLNVQKHYLETGVPASMLYKGAFQTR